MDSSLCHFFTSCLVAFPTLKVVNTTKGSVLRVGCPVLLVYPSWLVGPQHIRCSIFIWHRLRRGRAAPRQRLGASKDGSFGLNPRPFVSFVDFQHLQPRAGQGGHEPVPASWTRNKHGEPSKTVAPLHDAHVLPDLSGVKLSAPPEVGSPNLL